MARSFDGTNDRLDYDHSISSWTAVSGFAWLTWTGGGTSEYVLVDGNDALSSRSVLWNTAGTTDFAVSFGASTCAVYFNTLPSSTLRAYGFSWDGDTNNDPVAYCSGVDDSLTPVSTGGTWPGPVDKIQVGGRIAGGDRFWTGTIGNVALWNANLSAAEHLALARGASPLLIQPTKLVFYAPLNGADTRDWIGGLVPTDSGTTAAESRLSSIGGAQIIQFTPAAASGFQAAWARPSSGIIGHR